MRYLAALFSASLLFAACSSTKPLEMASLNQAPCTNEMQITDPKLFTGETAENLQVYQQGDLVFATMNVRTYCNATISFDVDVEGKQLRLKVNRASAISDSCVCNTNVTTSIRNIEPGDYNVIVTNQTGNQILAEQSATIK